MHATARIRLYRELGASRLWRYGCVALLSTRATREVIVNLREGIMSPHWYDTTGRQESGATSVSFGADQNREVENF